MNRIAPKPLNLSPYLSFLPSSLEPQPNESTNNNTTNGYNDNYDDNTKTPLNGSTGIEHDRTNDTEEAKEKEQDNPEIYKEVERTETDDEPFYTSEVVVTTCVCFTSSSLPNFKYAFIF